MWEAQRCLTANTLILWYLQIGQFWQVADFKLAGCHGRKAVRFQIAELARLQRLRRKCLPVAKTVLHGTLLVDIGKVMLQCYWAFDSFQSGSTQKVTKRVRLWTQWKLQFASCGDVCGLLLLLLSTYSFIKKAGCLWTDHHFASIFGIFFQVFTQLLGFQCLADCLHHILCFVVNYHFICPCFFQGYIL